MQGKPIAIDFNSKGLDDRSLITLYRLMLKPRLIEEKMLILLRQGKISKWFSGIGQEAISVGATAALMEDEFIFPMHRNLGVFTTRNIPLKRLFAQWQGKEAGFTSGRDRSFHFGAPDFGIIGMISHLGPQLSLADGVALANKLNDENKVALAFTGDGGTSQGEFHEALNVAAVWDLPVIFIIESNGYGLSTPSSEQFRAKNLADKGIGYGIESVTINGNNIIDVFNAVRYFAREIRAKPRPVIIECATFRVRGHEEASGVKYVPPELIRFWIDKDPIANYGNWLIKKGIITLDDIDKWRREIIGEIQEGLDFANSQPSIFVDNEKEIGDVFAHYEQIVVPPSSDLKRNVRFVDAIADAIDIAMEEHDSLVLMGQDIAEYGGVFKVTDGLLEKYGRNRVRNTPLCESAIVGIALGLSIKGIKSMMELQFADFVSVAINQITNNVAKVHYRWGQNADIVFRMPTGGGVAAGPFHSQSNEAWFTHTPGLKVVYPSNPLDAKGLLLAAFEDPNPVLFFEHKALYRSETANVPVGYYTIEIGKASIIRNGNDLSIITYGMGVRWAKEIVAKLEIDVEILDLRSLAPLDYEAIDLTVKKTNKVMILHEDVMIGGIGGDVSSYISENLFSYLDAPIIRVSGLDTPIPFDKELEKQFMANSRLEKAIEKILNY